MVDIKDAEAGEDEHDEEGDDFKSNLALFLWCQDSVDSFLAWCSTVSEIFFA